MDFKEMETQELIEIYKPIQDFISFLEKEKQDYKTEE